MAQPLAERAADIRTETAPCTSDLYHGDVLRKLRDAFTLHCIWPMSGRNCRDCNGRAEYQVCGPRERELELMDMMLGCSGRIVVAEEQWLSFGFRV